MLSKERSHFDVTYTIQEVYSMIKMNLKRIIWSSTFVSHYRDISIINYSIRLLFNSSHVTTTIKKKIQAKTSGHSSIELSLWREYHGV